MKNFLAITDLEPAEFWGLIERAEQIKGAPSRYIRALYEKTLLMIFEAPSLRTRLSFETAMTQLHGHAINYYTVHSPWGAGKESIEDVARTVSRYCDSVTARIFSHENLVNLAEHADVPVINAMTNGGHPCQIIGDFLTIKEQLGRTTDVEIAYLGDGQNNVTYSMMRAAVLTGNHLRVACPADAAYHPDPAVIREVEALAESHPGSVQIGDDPAAAARGAHVIYTDSWMSYRIPQAEKDQRRAALERFRVDARLMAQAHPDAVFMHCLPAMRGDEVTEEIIDGARSVVFDQAENRLHTEKAILCELLGGEADANT